MMHIKSIQEFHQNLILRSLPVLHIRMISRTISVLNVVDLDSSVPVSIELLEGCSDELLSELIHLPDDCSQELVVGDSSVLVHVEGVEERLGFWLSDSHSEIVDGFPEFGPVEGFGVVVVDDLEGSSEAHDSSSSSAQEGMSEYFERLILIIYLRRGCRCAQTSNIRSLSCVHIRIYFNSSCRHFRGVLLSGRRSLLLLNVMLEHLVIKISKVASVEIKFPGGS